MKASKENTCKGCKDYSHSNLMFCDAGVVDAAHCPYSTCLIKMMCDRECELFNKYIKLNKSGTCDHYKIDVTKGVI